LVSSVFSHQNASAFDYSRVVGAWLRLQSGELLEQDPMGLDSDECFAKMHEHRDMEDAIGVQVQVLDTVVLEETFEESAGREC
jgi:hypothetical protein